MIPDGALEVRSTTENACLDRIVEPEARYVLVAGAEKRHGRRFFRRKWARRTRRRSRVPTCTDDARLLSAGEEHSLAERIKIGDADAEQTLITANLGLVKKAVNDYAHCGVPDDDLIQEGSLGLIRAARQFDPANHTTRFATYATYWIRCFMIRALATNGSLIQKPEKSHLRRIQYRRALSELQAGETSLGSEPSPQSPDLDDIAPFLSVVPGRLELARLSENEQTIFQSLGEWTLADGGVPDHDLLKNENRAIVCAALRRLSPFEAWVIGERFGLGETAGHEPRLAVRRTDAVHETDGRTGTATTIDAGAVDAERVSEAYFQRSYIDMGRECGLSVFRLRQVEKTALDRLRGVLAQDAPERA